VPAGFMVRVQRVVPQFCYVDECFLAVWEFHWTVEGMLAAPSSNAFCYAERACLLPLPREMRELSHRGVFPFYFLPSYLPFAL
jgi:hypothetical protein